MEMMLNLANHMRFAAAGSFAATIISEVRAASIAQMLRVMRSPHVGGSQNALKPTKFKAIWVRMYPLA